MRRSGEDEGRRWIAQARQDLSDGRYLQGGERYHLACFLAQQAAEKALKAFLYSRGVEAPWGHSAADLSEAAASLDPSLKEFHSEAAGLDKYYIPTRYPNGLPGGLPADAYGPADSDAALSSAERVIEAVERRMG